MFFKNEKKKRAKLTMILLTTMNGAFPVADKGMCSIYAKIGK